MSRRLSFASLALLLVLAACGGGGSGSGSSSSTSFQQAYTASASVGEVLNYTFNSVNNTYSYTIAKSAYGLANTTVSGSLIANADGTYSPSTVPAAKLYATQNKVIGGALPLTGLGTVPFLGIASPSTTAPAIAGTYNFVALKCSAQSNGSFTIPNCGTEYGTMKFDNATNPVSYTFCTSANLTSGTGSCSPLITGRANHLGSGIWQLTDSSSNNIAVYFLGMQGANGQKIGVLDFNNSLGLAGGFKFGQAVMAEQLSTTMADVAGSYVYFMQNGTAGSMDLMSNGQTNLARIFTANTPWTGMAVSNATGNASYAIFSGAGFYVYRDPALSAFAFEIGIAK